MYFLTICNLIYLILAKAVISVVIEIDSHSRYRLRSARAGGDCPFGGEHHLAERVTVAASYSAPRDCGAGW